MPAAPKECVNGMGKGVGVCGAIPKSRYLDAGASLASFCVDGTVERPVLEMELPGWTVG